MRLALKYQDPHKLHDLWINVGRTRNS